MQVMSYSNDLASRVRAARLAANMTQEKLAAASGVVTSTISKIERGVSDSPDLGTLRAIAGALGLDPRELLPAAGAVDDAGKPYEALKAFFATPFGRATSPGERAMLESLRLPPGEEPNEILYQQLLVAYRLSRHSAVMSQPS